MGSPVSRVSDLDGEGIQAELRRILASDVFSNAPILSRFLSYLVQRRIAGNTAPPKEYTIGVDVFQRGADFDPRVDTIVRVQARRLRERLSRYYEDQGRADPVRITVPKGHYQVEIVDSETDPNVTKAPRIPPEPPVAGSSRLMPGPQRREGSAPRWRRAAGIGVVIAAVLMSAVYWHFANRQGVEVRTVAPVASKASAAQGVPFNPPADTIVVLPFTHLNGDPRQQYFSDGITAKLANVLGQTTRLRVIAWDTASHYRDRQESATEIGRALNVAHVLTGKILLQDNKVRVIVELVDARTGYQEWADHHDYSRADGEFQVQDQIAAAIASALEVKFASPGAVRGANP